jgi:ABC-type lipoprotein release transport system permease subunit
MKTLISIAWRNIWRNRLRSIVVVISIVLGLWAGMFIMGMSIGMNNQRMDGAIDSTIAHLQIHHPEFLIDFNKKYTLEDSDQITDQLDHMSEIKAYSKRLIITAMAATVKGNYGVQLMGIDPNSDKRVVDLYNRLVSGTYFEKFKRNPIVIGQKLADQLGVAVASKIVLTFQDQNNNIISKNFRVEGIFRSPNTSYDLSTVFVKREDVERLIGLEGRSHQIIIRCNTLADVDGVKTSVQTSMDVETWGEVSPELGYAQETMSAFIYVFMGIILLALAFGIINTMLMAILERKKELGMLISIGMNKRRVFVLIVVETLFLTLIALPFGIGFSYLTNWYFSIYGIDLSVVATGLESMGLAAVIYTYLPLEVYFNVSLMTFVVSMLSGMIPARRALKINPAEAVKSA